MRNRKSGFTLIEILLVVAAIGILAGIVILAINPNKQLGDTRNAQRKADVTTILNAVYQYSIDNNGALPADIPTVTAKVICTNATPSVCTTANFAYIGEIALNEKYVTSIPKDPSATVTDSAGYTILKTANNRVTVAAPLAEDGAVISATR